ncbi:MULTISPECIES: hypothetical protein [Rahnella]|uniref:hypothetical protein n=1 Tax=Rahnella TaxID=34037 RepID=UPI00101C79AB|nr:MULTISPECIES: hypothetical protein [Rahnella]RYJ11844.1 hypothetical protein C5Y41_20180 [Rahnella variigena]TCQ91903.1 acyl-CoA dehydrogenase-like protein [Rahnella sp. JUb53]
MSEEEFTRLYFLFRDCEPSEAFRQMRRKWADPASGVLCGGYQLLAAEGETCAEQHAESDRILASLGMSLQHTGKEIIPDDPIPLMASFAARLGLLSQIMAVSWKHLSARKSFGVKTTRHQLVKADFADLSSQTEVLLLQWQMRIAMQDFADPEADHWQLTVLTNRAEKLMGGHGYLSGSTHSLSYLSMMIYSLYGKTAAVAMAALPERRELRV